MRRGLNRLLVIGVGLMMGFSGICSEPDQADMKSYSWENVEFKVPVAFSGPDELGPGAVFFTHPPAAKPKEAKFEIILTKIGAKQVQAMGMDDAGLLNYVKSTYHGTAKPPESHHEREINGQVVKGEVLSKSIPKKSRLELYLIALSDGGKLALAFTIDAGMPEHEAEKIAGVVADTLRF